MSGSDTRRDSDLARIEDALAESAATAADPRERELQDLALALRADSPEPSAAFAHELGARVGDGFGKAKANAKPPRLRWRLWAPALAGAAALVLVAVAAFGSLGHSDAPRVTSAVEKAPASGALAPNATSIAPSSAPRSPFLAEAGRRVERDAQLTISTPRDQLQQAADGVGTVAERHRGFVLSSQVTTGDSGTPGGSFVLRVPSSELQTTLADLSKLGHLRARSESGQDMTASYNGVQDKLGNALVERRTLKLRLRHASGPKADAIRARLAELSAAVSSLSGQMRRLRSRTAYSTVSLTLEQDSGGAGGAGGSGGGIGAAWHDALHTLEALLTFAVRALGVLLPLGLLAAIAGFGGRALRRRRREAALG
jgi:hypothetical protein